MNMCTEVLKEEKVIFDFNRKSMPEGVITVNAAPIRVHA